MISDSSNPSVKNAYPSFSYSIDTSSRTAVRSRRLFYASAKVISHSFRRSSFQKQNRTAASSLVDNFGSSLCWVLFLLGGRSAHGGFDSPHLHHVVADCSSFATTFLCLAVPEHFSAVLCSKCRRGAFFRSGIFRFWGSCMPPLARVIVQFVSVFFVQVIHSFIDCFRQRFGIERLLFCLLRKPDQDEHQHDVQDG